ncbi:unnamed protein product [Rhodiola kirilowii]
MSHAGSRMGDNIVDERADDFVEHPEDPPPFYDDPERLIRERNRIARRGRETRSGSARGSTRGRP